MLRQAARRLLGAGQRNLSTSAARLEEAAPAGPKEFAEAWAKKAPALMAVPELPSNFLKATGTGDSKVTGDLFPVNFYTPHGLLSEMQQVVMVGGADSARADAPAIEPIVNLRELLHAIELTTSHACAAQKDAVILPGVDGVFGLKANHVPLISQLKPGVVELHSGTDVEKFFVSGGFAFVHPNGVADICVLEAATLDQIDPAAVKAALTAASAGQGQGDEEDQAASRAAVELYSALDSALDNKA